MGDNRRQTGKTRLRSCVGFASSSSAGLIGEENEPKRLTLSAVGLCGCVMARRASPSASPPAHRRPRMLYRIWHPVLDDADACTTFAQYLIPDGLSFSASAWWPGADRTQDDLCSLPRRSADAASVHRIRPPRRLHLRPAQAFWRKAQARTLWGKSNCPMPCHRFMTVLKPDDHAVAVAGGDRSTLVGADGLGRLDGACGRLIR